MLQQFERHFLNSCAAILLLTSAAKLVSAGGQAGILEYYNPVFKIFRNNQLLLLVGLLELVLFVALICKMPQYRKLLLIVWFSAAILCYRLQLHLVGEMTACSCLGTVGDALGLAPATIDITMQIAIAWMVIGSIAFLILRLTRASSSPESK